MKLGYHQVMVRDYTAGTNKNGKKVLDMVVENREGETINVQLYFASPQNIKISLEQMGRLGWSKDHPDGLDAIKLKPARIEVYEEEYTNRDGNTATTVKARFSKPRDPFVEKPMSKSAAQKFLAELADPTRSSAFGDPDPEYAQKRW